MDRRSPENGIEISETERRDIAKEEKSTEIGRSDSFLKRLVKSSKENIGVSCEKIVRNIRKSPRVIRKKLFSSRSSESLGILQRGNRNEDKPIPPKRSKHNRTRAESPQFKCATSKRSPHRRDANEEYASSRSVSVEDVDELIRSEDNFRLIQARALDRKESRRSSVRYERKGKNRRTRSEKNSPQRGDVDFTTNYSSEESPESRVIFDLPRIHKRSFQRNQEGLDRDEIDLGWRSKEDIQGRSSDKQTRAKKLKCSPPPNDRLSRFSAKLVQRSATKRGSSDSAGSEDNVLDNITDVHRRRTSSLHSANDCNVYQTFDYPRVENTSIKHNYARSKCGIAVFADTPKHDYLEDSLLLPLEKEKVATTRRTFHSAEVQNSVILPRCVLTLANDNSTYMSCTPVDNEILIVDEDLQCIVLSDTSEVSNSRGKERKRNLTPRREAGSRDECHSDSRNFSSSIEISEAEDNPTLGCIALPFTNERRARSSGSSNSESEFAVNGLSDNSVKLQGVSGDKIVEARQTDGEATLIAKDSSASSYVKKYREYNKVKRSNSSKLDRNVSSVRKNGRGSKINQQFFVKSRSEDTNMKLTMRMIRIREKMIFGFSAFAILFTLLLVMDLQMDLGYSGHHLVPSHGRVRVGDEPNRDTVYNNFRRKFLQRVNGSREFSGGDNSAATHSVKENEIVGSGSAAAKTEKTQVHDDFSDLMDYVLNADGVNSETGVVRISGEDFTDNPTLASLKRLVPR